MLSLFPTIQQYRGWLTQFVDSYFHLDSTCRCSELREDSILKENCLVPEAKIEFSSRRCFTKVSEASIRKESCNAISCCFPSNHSRDRIEFIDCSVRTRAR